MLFDKKDIGSKLEDVERDLAFDQLKHHSHDILEEYQQKLSPFHNDYIKRNEDGSIDIIYRTNPRPCNMFISGLEEGHLPFRIRYFYGNRLVIEHCSIKSLKDIFTDDSIINGMLEIRSNSNLISLEGCPRRAKYFNAYRNPELPLGEFRHGPTRCNDFSWYIENTNPVSTCVQIYDEIVRADVIKPYFSDKYKGSAERSVIRVGHYSMIVSGTTTHISGNGDGNEWTTFEAAIQEKNIKF